MPNTNMPAWASDCRPRGEVFAAAPRALAADEGLAGAHTILGVILSNTGRKGDAIDSWKRAVALDASEFNALYNLWLELAAAGRREEAVQFGRQFMATAPPAFFAAERQQIEAYLRNLSGS